MISAAINYCTADRALVDAFDALDAPKKLGSYWTDSTLEKLKSRIKSHYIDIQNVRCCYCNQHQNSKNHRIWDVEHIAPRAKYAHFMFTPHNLAASCPDCNQSKGDTEVLVNPGRKTYPKKSEDFKIFHPHYDSYTDHILKSGFVYTPKSNKGKFTIYTCDLLRFATEFIDWSNSATDTSFEEEVDIAFEASPEAAMRAVDSIAAKLHVR